MKKDTHIIARSGWCSVEHDQSMLAYAAKTSGRKSPRILFMNTASSSTPRYAEGAQKAIEAAGGVFSTFDFFGSIQTDYADFITSHDVIYVGGGNTRSMLALWREYGVDKALRDAWQNGVVLTGFSAGAICWFEQCLTDALQGTPQVINGLGFLRGSACPHYDVEPSRRPTYMDLASKQKISAGYALVDFTAIHFVNGEPARLLTTQEGKAPVYVNHDGSERLLDATMLGNNLEKQV